MFLTKIFAQRSLPPSFIVFNISRALQHQASRRKSVETHPTQNRKPKFDAIHFEESVKPYAEDITLENQHEKLSNMILPLSNHSYDDQLKIKQDIVEQSFDQIGRAILWDKRIDNQVLKYVEFQEGHFCHVEPIVPSPAIENYRCKDDLSCGYGVDGQKTIGFYINPRNNKKFPNSLCIPPIHLKSMKPKHRLVVKHFDQFLKQHPLSVCESSNIFKKDQYWRSVSLKSNAQDDLMMIVVVHPQSLTKSEIDQMKTDLINYFIHGSGQECQINSIYFQTCTHNRYTGDQNPFELIHGSEFIYETYHEKKFRISPGSFLQVNQKSAQFSYSATLKHAGIDENTILLDIGSGVYSILASAIAKKVYAIDSLAMCIEDGKFNAKINECRDNIEWICGFAEANLHRILKKIGDLHGDHSRIVAIINPSRYSLTTKTTDVLRSLSAIERIIYLLGKSDEQTMHNFYGLAAGERSKLKQIGRPFIPTDIYPIDILPHTTHSDILVKCVRTLLKDSRLLQSMASLNDDSYESIGLVKPEVYVYVIPPRQSATRKHRAADWKLDAPNFICRLKIISKGEKCLIRLEDRNTGAHFATCPVESYPSIAVENVEDSTRYFVVRVQNDNGQQAFLGIGFNDRSDSFDFNVALQDHFKYLKQAKQIEQEAKETASDPFKQQQPKLDLSFKEGQTIKINLKSSLPGEESTKKPAKNTNESFIPGILPPPPGSTIPKLTPPPGSTIPKIAPPTLAQPSAATTNTNDVHSDLSWMQF